ncbi:MAG: hypothetical protein ACYCPN_02805 [Thermoplasmata archaeon]
MTGTSAPAGRSSATGWITFGLFIVIGGLFLGGVYLFLKGQPFWALFWVGIIALVFALASYLAGALTPDPRFQRGLGAGYYGLGFIVLYSDLVVNPGSTLSSAWQFVTLALVTLALAATVIAIGWRLRSIAKPPREGRDRDAWRQSGGSPSAFSYTAAHSPSNPTPMPAPSSPTPPPPGGGR